MADVSVYAADLSFFVFRQYGFKEIVAVAYLLEVPFSTGRYAAFAGNEVIFFCCGTLIVTVIVGLEYTDTVFTRFMCRKRIVLRGSEAGQLRFCVQIMLRSYGR